MKRFMMTAAVLTILLLAGCSTPHKLPEAPTPIPTLAPASLPEPQKVEQAPESVPQPEEELDSGASQTGDVAAGAEVFQANGCSACHALDGTAGVGPGLGGLFGAERAMEGGGSVVADEDYLRNAIVAPGDELVSGFGNLMPASFGDLLSEDEILNLIAYLKELGND